MGSSNSKDNDDNSAYNLPEFNQYNKVRPNLKYDIPYIYFPHIGEEEMRYVTSGISDPLEVQFLCEYYNRMSK